MARCVALRRARSSQANRFSGTRERRRSAHPRARARGGLQRGGAIRGCARRRTALKQLHPTGTHAWALIDLVEAALRCGQHERARVARSTADRTRLVSTEWGLRLEARCAALLAEQASQRRSTTRRSATRPRADRPDLARAHLLYGEWLRREGRRLDAREQLREAYDMFSEMGVPGFAERARRELAATSETARKRTDETRGDLTAQESQIAQLASEGLRTQRSVPSSSSPAHCRVASPKGLSEARRRLPQGAARRPRLQLSRGRCQGGDQGAPRCEQQQGRRSSRVSGPIEGGEMPPLISRGFRGRRDDAPGRPRAAGPVPDDRLPVLSAGPDPPHPARAVGLLDRRRGRRAAPLDLGGVPRAAERGRHGRHPLRDQVVEAGHGLGGRLASTRCWTGSRPRGVRHRLLRRRLHDQPAARGRHRTARPGWRSPTTASRSRRSTAARRACWCRTSTSGRAPSGCAGCSCSRRRARASGSRGYHNYGDPWREQRYWGD